MFAGIDVASERHVLARLDGTGQPLGRLELFADGLESMATDGLRA